jgi:hypothetical protein
VTSEIRRAPRFKASLRVQIVGIDPAPVPRKGDVSATGLLVDIDRDIGPLGSMQRLLLLDDGGGSPVTVLARVVRIAAVDDFWKGRTVTGVAFQFLFEEEAATGTLPPRSHPANESPGIARLLRALMEHAAKRKGVEVKGWRGTIDTGGGPKSAALQDLSVRGLVLETDYAVAKGRTIRVELPGRSPEETISFEGQVEDCVEDDSATASPGRFRARVRFRAPPEADDDEAPPSGMGDTMSAAFSSLLDAVSGAGVSPGPQAQATQLSGDLARISLVSVLTLCHLERVTGVLSLHDGAGRRVSVYLRSGEILDAEAEGETGTARAALGAALGWHAGKFAVEFGPVNRPRRFQDSPTSLLLDLTRELDEQGRPR